MAPTKKAPKPKRPVQKNTRNGKPNKSKKAAAASSAATTATASPKKAMRYVPHSSLAWSTVHVPTEAFSGGAGTTDSTFFHGFSFDDDDFMGLQEIEDVDVEFEKTKDGGKTIKFKAAEYSIKGKGGKGKKKALVEEQAEAGEAGQSEDEEDEDLRQAPPAAKQSGKRKRTEAAQDVDDYISPFAAEEDAIAASASEDQAGNQDEEDGEADFDDDDPIDGEEADLTPDEEDEDDVIDEEADEELEDDDLAVAFSKAQSAGLALDGEGDDDEGDDGNFDESLLPGWSALPLHSELKRALYNMKFEKPTEIQARSLPPALGLQGAESDVSSDEEGDSDADDSEVATVGNKKDVVGISQTGSGKTLAYGLPILQWLYHNAPGSVPMPSIADEAQDDDDDDSLPPPLGALIITPTRELALQVATHLSDVIRASCRSSPSDETVSKRKLSQRPHIAVICGGMSEQKQKRMLEGRSRSSGGADIIVATPGRLWEMARLDDRLAGRIKRTRFLVLDEADRMVEVGHFAEMEHILKLVSRDSVEAPEDDAAGSDDGEDDGGDGLEPLTVGVRPSDNMQTFVFSATLSKALQKNLQKRKRISPKDFKKRRGKKANAAEATTLDDLMERIDFRDERPTVVDLTGGQGLPEGLMETKVECLHTDKDLYLYYFLLRYPGRTLVFVNSIDGIRRLQPILANLRINVFPLHSQLQQKQRLKNLDRFRATQLSRAKTAGEKIAAASHDSTNGSLGGSSSVLLATDVAARGLDIPAVDHVVHYQLPRSADSYVHRSGRTARAGGTGVALALIEPKEKKLWSSLCRTLSRRQDTLALPIIYSLLPALKHRLALSRELDQKRHKTSKASHEDSWLRSLASEAELDFHNGDSDSDGETPGGSGGGGGKGRKAKIYSAQVRDLEAQLEVALRQPLKQRGTSRKYITTVDLGGTGKGSLASQLVGDAHHETVLGLDQSSASKDLSALSSRQPSATAAASRKQKKQKKEKATNAAQPRARVPSAVPVASSAVAAAPASAKKPTTSIKQKRRAKEMARQVLKMKRAGKQ
ncbi:uncharacterized protein PFL1_00617 [Pseudozyma flocculosa PF-1]|uniref:ATP-dependent RNA helicase n=1 Tax=Pseudozyma flocculosa TaxID=84751 RepID=A0A5C3EQX1_9BASI|nr:uncharacterized protein PFL1_00617 [Pseudozyma flocculosa PF-1]EPQ32421.1 hypothetical protein PFL1_00617 [Pseudozyma flocculosa PF-1]SPO34598.1 related to MAK5 - ATP-dependent RNA helicase [Pseudozyma flocculosa]